MLWQMCWYATSSDIVIACRLRWGQNQPTCRHDDDYEEGSLIKKVHQTLRAKACMNIRGSGHRRGATLSLPLCVYVYVHMHMMENTGTIQENHTSTMTSGPLFTFDG